MVTQGGNSTHMSFQLTSHRLNGKNYLEWAQSLIEETKKPEVGDPKMNALIGETNTKKTH
ncbi:hypothetical protein A4A49_63751 [Nicotiana attenuata]|uniref:Retrotransposon Copia-like N-terminal domain-containing protein n=1 Tax=Nicotiana attenuata TaxID=49451 RepID=A0A314KLB7_NICAT|nr:hypothetical protein A4A49_63751 [Nicotiana attenuata]